MGKRGEERDQRGEGRGERGKDRGQREEDRGKRWEDRGQKANCSRLRQRLEGRRRQVKAEGRRYRLSTVERRRKREEKGGKRRSEDGRGAEGFKKNTKYQPRLFLRTVFRLLAAQTKVLHLYICWFKKKKLKKYDRAKLPKRIIRTTVNRMPRMVRIDALLSV